MSNAPTETVINDRYEIRSRAGRGGMADVFVAYDRLLDRQVAIKVLFPEFAIDPHFVERFRREAQSAANLSHPNIVNVYDWGRYENTYFIAMEYVSGRTLAEILQTNDRLTPKQAAEIASEVAAALGFAHEGGVAHRDIKPANILIGSNGQVKVADFGIARAMNSATENNLTQAGSVMGTAAYFSPEQAQGAQPDPRSDLYSLGIVMYEMVAGKPPFAGENAVAIAYKQVHDQPKPLNQMIEGVPRSFEAIVAKLLAKNPTLRYPNAHDLRDDLRRFRNGEQVMALVAAAARPTASVETEVAPVQTVAIDATPVGTTRAYTAQPRFTPQTTNPTDAPPVNVSAYPPGSSPDARYYQENQNRTGWYALAAFIALIAIVVGGFWLYQQITNEANQTSSVTLEDYRGWLLQDAIADLEKNGLAYSPQAREDPTKPENEVLETDPAAKQVVVKGSTVTLYYNPSKKLKAVPDVTNMPYAQAADVLRAAGFTVVEPISEVSDTVEAEHVIKTDPAAETNVPEGSAITVYVSSGLDEVLVPPSIINMQVDEAKALLESDQYGLTVTVTQRVDAQVAEGIVLESNPAPNNYVARGSQIELIVSAGPGTVQVPNMVGDTEPEAREKLANLGLIPTIAVRDLPAGDPNDGKVVSQNRNPGDSVSVGSTVEIVIGKAAAQQTTTTAITITTPPPTTNPTTTSSTTSTTSTTSSTTTTTVAESG